MQIQPSPLTVIIDPSGVQSGMAGDTLELYVVISNESDQSAVIDVFFDEASETIRQWCQTLREKLALAPHQSSELTFQFEIPVDALPGTYDYTLVVDAPEHFPEDTPIQYPRQLKVMLKENTAIRIKDPTFSLKPPTNPSKAAILKPGESLQVEVTVNNRSDRVDRFFLTCPYLEEDWFTIRYEMTGLEGSGLLSGPSGLELNPNSQGQIWLIFHPPVDIFAGSYSPTIRLYSANSPDLVLLDLLYIEISTINHLNVELNTLLGKVSQTSGQYEIKLTNNGNTLRELEVGIKSRDERQLYTYECEPRNTQILPNRSSKVSLRVKPRPWWQRPLIGSGLNLNFVVDLKDKENLPLPENLPQGSLVWNARPLWQLLLLVLVILGSLAGLSFLIWWQFFKSPSVPKINNFTSDSNNYIEGDKVLLNWQISNSQQLSKLQLKIDGPDPATHQNIDVNLDMCENRKETREQTKICSNYNMGLKEPGDYTLTLTAFPLQQDKVSPNQTTLKVTIKEKPAPKIVNFRLDKKQYKVGDVVRLTWEIYYPDNLSALSLFGIREGTQTELDRFSRDQLISPSSPQTEIGKPKQTASNQTIQKQELATAGKKNLCTRQENKSKGLIFYSCQKVLVKPLQPGKYTFIILAFSTPIPNKQRPPSQSLPATIDILPKPLKIISFTLNGNQEPTRVINEGTPVNFSWKVQGSDDINVELSLFGKVSTSGSKQITANQALPSLIELTATDKFGNRDSKRFSIKVNPLPKPALPQPSFPPRPSQQPSFPLRPLSSPTLPIKQKK